MYCNMKNSFHLKCIHIQVYINILLGHSSYCGTSVETPFNIHDLEDVRNNTYGHLKY